MSYNGNLLDYESVMIRKTFMEYLGYGIIKDANTRDTLEHWCSHEKTIKILESKSNEKYIGLRLQGNSQVVVFNMTVEDFEKYFFGWALIPSGCGEAVANFINGYKKLSYYGDMDYNSIKYDIMELFYDIELVDNPTDGLFSVVGERFFKSTEEKNVVENKSTGTFIDERGNIPVVEPLTDEDYVAIGKGIYEVVKGCNIKFFEEVK
jgi:hypothetical protein